MDKRPLNKSLTGKTGKDILNLISSKEKPVGASTLVKPVDNNQKSLFEIWESLLGHSEFGIEDDFFKIGGSSIKGIQMLSRIFQHFEVELSLTEVFLNATISHLALLIKDRKRPLKNASLLKNSPRPKHIPLSFSQERIYFLDRLEGSLQYHIPAVIRLKGRVNIKALEFAFREILSRHEALRTVFVEQEGQLSQIILEKNTGRLNLHNGLRFSEKSSALEKFIEGLVLKPFNLSADLMIRADLVTLADQEFVLVMVLHHIAADGWSIPILVHEVAELYHSFCEERQAALPHLQVQYADFTLWQRAGFSPDILSNKLEYWKSKLDGITPLELPTDFKRPAIRGIRGTTKLFHIESGLLDKIHSFENTEGTTLYMTLLAAFNVLLYRYSGQHDISVGASMANRPRQELENLIGFFVNTLTFRNQINPQESFKQFLQQVKTTSLEAYEHQDVPFEKVVEAVVKDRDPSRSPLFQVMLVYVNTPGSSKLELDGVELILEDYVPNISKFDFTFHVRENENGLDISVEYSTDLYKQSTIEQMMSHYEAILNAVVDNPEQKISEIGMLSEKQINELTTGVNTSTTTYPKDETLIDIVSNHASQTPLAEALIFENETLNYKELNDKANQWANTLIDSGLKPGSMVGLYMERGAEMITAMLGILKAGCAYVPIDKDFPIERIGYMLKDTGSKLVLSDQFSKENLEGIPGIKIITKADTPTSEPNIKITQKDTAYIIYTSGSTGKPKGVMINHQNLMDYVYGLDQKLNLSECKSFALVSSIATDLGNTSILGAWKQGASLHVFSKEMTSDAYRMNQYFKQNKVDCLKIVPSHWKALSSETMLLPNTMLIFGGEALQGSMVKQIQEQSNIRIINHYGPTETTIGKLLHETNKDQTYDRTVPIGKPFGNTTVFVLSKDKTLCPIGVHGELYITGDGLSKGYLNQAELTEEKFIDNPFGKSKLYATGDMVKYHSDGSIEYLGRIDDQVKIRGYRIEPSEIETTLAQNPQIKQAVVLLKQDSQGNPKLVAYIIPKSNYKPENLTTQLKEQLPEYMIPSRIVELESFPTLANGKIDRKALPDPDDQPKAGGYQAPASPTEQTMAGLWEDILEVEKVGIHDDFFELGGHSLLAIRLVSAIRKAFEVEMPIGDIFDYPTIAELSHRIAIQSDSALLPPVEKVQQRPEKIPLSFSQERLWFIDQLEGSIQYHTPSILSLKGILNIEALEFAFKALIERHEVLRTVIHEDAGRGYQTIKNEGNWKLEIIKDKQFANDFGSLEQFIRQLIDAPFDLSKDYMLRAHLICLAVDDYVLVVTQHHIASDRWSTSIMVSEFIELYKSYLNQRPSELLPLKIQYADYAIWQRRYLTQEVLDKKIDYWKQKLQGFSQLEMPLDYPRSSVWSAKGAQTSFTIDKRLSLQLSELSQMYGVTLFMTMLAAFKALLYRYTSQKDISVGTSIANRKNQDMESMIGFFVNTISLRTQLQGSLTFTELLKLVKSTTMEAYEHLDAPYEKVVDALVSERDMSRNALFQILFVMHNTPEIPEIGLQDVELSVLPINHDVSRFDFSISLTETEEGIMGQMQYCTDLYKSDTIERLIEHYKVLLKSVANNPEQKLDILPLLTISEKEYLLKEFNNKGSLKLAYPNIIEWFEIIAKRFPESVALQFEGTGLSYRELDERSNQLANFLIAKGILPETPLPLFIERGPEMIIAMLGIMKSGAAYVPIDTEFPKDRLAYILEDTEARFVISSQKGRKQLPDVQNFEVIDIESIKTVSASNPGIKISPDQLAYLIYTSGSTGQPKGVMVEHQNIVDYVTGLDKEIDIRSCKSFALVSTIATDLGNTVIFGSLLTGGTLHLFSKEKADNIEWIHQYFLQNEVDCLKIVPSHWKALRLDQKFLMPKKLLIFGGEAMDNSIVSNLKGMGSSCKVINHYGPTETTIGKLLYKVNLQKTFNTSVPIGKPFSNTLIYVLNREKQLCPVGVPGQLFIGGEGVARGYLNKDELTGSKFIPDPFSVNQNDIIYATGDLVKYLADGNIEFLGRVDDQVKIRGYRVELGEIESVLKQSDLVNEAAVLAWKDDHGNVRLIAYILSHDEFDRDALVFSVKDKLPDYMLPSVYVKLDKIPLTPNGKLDRKALPDPELTETADDDFVAPRNDIEETLAGIWKILLKTDKVSVHDNFFDFGGDSIITLQFVSRVRRAGYELQPKDVFVYQTIAGLGSLIEKKANKAKENLDAVQSDKGAFGLLPIQQWYFEREQTQISHYNQSVLLKIDKSINGDILKRVFETLLSRNDALRTIFKNTNGEWHQETTDQKIEISVEDLKNSDKKKLASEIEQLANKYQESLDIDKGRLVKFVWIETPGYEDKNRLLMVIHHLAVDGVSWHIILEDTEILIDQILKNEKPDLGKKSGSIRQWNEALSKFSKSKGLLSEKFYWSKIVNSEHPVPVDFDSKESVKIKERRSLEMALDKEATKNLIQEVPKTYHTEINDLLLLALAMTISEWSGSDNVLIGLEGHGRESVSEDMDISRTVGWFTSIFPVLINLESDQPMAERINSVKSQLRSIPNRGIGFGILKYLAKEPSLQKKEPWDMVFNYLGQSDLEDKGAKWLSKAEESSGNNVSSEQLFLKKLVLNAMVQSDKLILSLNYSGKHYKETTIRSILENYIDNLKSIIHHCLEQQITTKKSNNTADSGSNSNPDSMDSHRPINDEDIDSIMSF